MKFDVFDAAAEVIGRASRERPADQLLRELFKRHRNIAPFDAAEVSGLVFAYFRWLGWLEQEREITGRLRRARELSARFRGDRASFSDEELRSKAVPGWVLDEVSDDRQWLLAIQQEPRLWLRARQGQGRSLAERLGRCHPAGQGALADTLEYRGEEDLFRTPEFHAGDFELQDVSSQAVGFVCDPQPGQTWWDACAGEGGKLLHLSDLMGNKGLIWASDRAAWRIQKLKRRAARAKVFNYRAELWDGGPKLPTRTKFDGILVDAPCSGVGTWQRNPHARWTTTMEDVRELSAVQKNLLRHAAAALKPGGKLIYSVCTLTKSETGVVADTLEREFPGLKPLPFVNPLAPSEAAASRVCIWPQESGGNGMFIAAWQNV